MNKSGIRTVLVQDSCLFALTALLVTGCVSTPRQSYTGDPLPDSQIARLSVEPKKQSFWQTMNSRPFAKALPFGEAPPARAHCLTAFKLQVSERTGILRPDTARSCR